MGAVSQDADVEGVQGCHHGACPRGESTGLESGPVVHAENGVHRESTEQPRVQHLFGAAGGFFGRLEDEAHRAGEIAVLGQVAGSTQQHRGVAIVAAGVHLPGMFRAVGERIRFFHRKGVHVRAQADRRSLARGQRAHHASLGEALIDTNAPGAKALGNQAGGSMLAIGKFRMGVQIPAPGDKVGFKGPNFRNDPHHDAPSRRARAMPSCSSSGINSTSPTANMTSTTEMPQRWEPVHWVSTPSRNGPRKAVNLPENAKKP